MVYNKSSDMVSEAAIFVKQVMGNDDAFPAGDYESKSNAVKRLIFSMIQDVHILDLDRYINENKTIK